MSDVAATITVPAELGSTCRVITRRLDAPAACAASTYSRARNELTVARTTRATLVQSTIINQRPNSKGGTGQRKITTSRSTATAGTETTTPVSQLTTASNVPP